LETVAHTGSDFAYGPPHADRRFSSSRVQTGRAHTHIGQLAIMLVELASRNFADRAK
jgi:hypothetical protein